MIAPSNRSWILLLLAGLFLSFGHADAQQEPEKSAPKPVPDRERGLLQGAARADKPHA
jgi:hypothetical protein